MSKRYIVLAAVSLLLAACTDFKELGQSEILAGTVLKTNLKALEFGVSATSQTLELSSGSQWSIISKPEWVRVTARSPKKPFVWDLDVSVTQNTGYERTETITFRNYKGTETSVTVTQQGSRVKVTSISITQSEYKVNKGRTVQLNATILPSNATNKSVTWSSSNTTKASVSTTGVVTGLAGTPKDSPVIITARSDDQPDLEAYCSVTVYAPVESVTVTPPTLTLGEGKTYDLSASVMPTDATEPECTWSSSAPAIVKVNATTGHIEALKSGRATIYATTPEGVRGSCSVTVSAALTKIDFDCDNPLTVRMGTPVNVKLLFTPTTATEKDYTPVSGKTSVATVAKNGESITITPKSIGSAVITVTSTSYPSVKAQLTVNVKESYQRTAVNLGLPSGTKWSNLNLEAEAPEEAGGYFAWGEVTSKKTFSWDNYKWETSSSITKYRGKTDHRTVLLMSDDAARSILGSSWRMPTREEISELYSNTSKSWTTVDGVAGCRFTGPNGNSIFIPATGYMSGSTLYSTEYIYLGNAYLNWDDERQAYGFRLKNGGALEATYPYRYYGQTIRPVQGKDIVYVSSVSLSPSSAQVEVGKKLSLTTTVSPSNATYASSLVWSTSDSAIAEYDPTYRAIVGKKEGTAKITVTTIDGAYSSSCSVTVKKAQNISFADSYVKSICVANWDKDKDGELSMEEAAAVESLGTVFRSNKSITKFEELINFTKLTEISNYAFEGCSSLEKVILPPNITRIGLAAFDQCNLKTVDIPSKVNTIAEKAFTRNVNLSSFTGALVASGGRCLINSGNLLAFAPSGLKSFTIPSDVKVIVNRVFYYCSFMESLTLPATVSQIGTSAFYGCSSLKSVTVKASTPPSCGSDAFYSTNNCPIYVPSSALAAYKSAWSSYASRIVAGDIAFADPKVKAICINKWDTDKDGMLSMAEAAAVSYDQFGATFSGNSEITTFNEFQYFTGVTTLYAYAFRNCTNLKSIVLPSTLQSIGGYAFANTALTSIDIPQSVNTLHNGMFRQCAKLESFTGRYASSDHKSLVKDNILYAIAPSGLTDYDVPSNVTRLQDYVFHLNDKLVRVRVPASVTKVGSYAFRGCTSLEYVIFKRSTPPTGGNYMFDDTTCKIYVPSASVSSYQNATYWSNYKSRIAAGDISFKDNYVRNVCLSKWDKDKDSVISIEEAEAVTSSSFGESFNGNTQITSFDEFSFFTGVTSIGKAFYGCIKLASITLPSTLKEIGDYAFYSTALTSVNIPQSVSSIGKGSFSNCASLKSFTGRYASDGGRILLKDDTVYAFAPSGLTEYSIPDGVKNIADNAFFSCSKMQYFTVPTSVKTVGAEAFRYCTSLKSMEFQPYTPPTAGNRMLDNTNNCDIFVPKSALSTYQQANVWHGYASRIKASGAASNVIDFADSKVREICLQRWDTNGDGALSYDEAAAVTTLNKAFKDNQEITSFDELEYFTGIKTLAYEEFYCCKKLKSVKLPKGLETIGQGAFERCVELESVEMNDGLKTISAYAFYGCEKLSSVYLPNSVNVLGNNPFFNCFGLSSFSGKCASSDGSMLINGSTLVSFAPSGKTTCSVPSTVSTIGAYAFANCSELTSISLPSTITVIGFRAISNCYGLSSISIPNGVTSIESYAFAWCSGLGSIIIPGNVQSIGNDAFYFCSKLSSINIPESVQTIGDGAFANCKNLSYFSGKFAADNGRCLVDNSGRLFAFAPYGITSYSIPIGVTSIGYNTFYYCTNLQNVTIPSSVTSIGSSAFNNCNSLGSITVNATTPPKLVDSYVFYNTNNCPIYVPAVSVSAYKSAAKWSDLSSRISAKTDYYNTFLGSWKVARGSTYDTWNISVREQGLSYNITGIDGDSSLTAKAEYNYDVNILYLMSQENLGTRQMTYNNSTYNCNMGLYGIVTHNNNTILVTGDYVILAGVLQDSNTMLLEPITGSVVDNDTNTSYEATFETLMYCGRSGSLFLRNMSEPLSPLPQTITRSSSTSSVPASAPASAQSAPRNASPVKSGGKSRTSKYQVIKDKQ